MTDDYKSETPSTIETKSGRTEIFTCLSYFMSASSAIIKATVYLLLSAAQSMEKIRFVPPCFFLVPTKVKGAGMTLALKRNTTGSTSPMKTAFDATSCRFIFGGGWCGVKEIVRLVFLSIGFYNSVQDNLALNKILFKTFPEIKKAK
jgi:hypothetical protein